MRLLFIADGRSPIAQNWIAHFCSSGYEVHLISTFPCVPQLELSSLHVVSVAFSAAARHLRREAGRAMGGAKGIRWRAFMRHWIGPLSLPWSTNRAHALMQKVDPDLVHAMRIPFEGILAASANPATPLIISVWGNDFTLHAHTTPIMGYLTRRTLLRADALHLDCERDLRLARERGFSSEKPTFVSPGAGGVRPEIFHPGQPNLFGLGERLANELRAIPPESMVVVNPRGFRAYVRNDTFFQAIPKVLQDQPNVIFLCPAMADEAQALRWVDQLNISNAVRLLPMLRPKEMAAVFQRSQVMVSPTEHDGTPNTLLEGMACGSFPVAGDLESIREWIDDGVNGFLIDPDDPEALARAICKALSSTNLLEVAAERNQQLIHARAAYPNTMVEAESFYRQVAV